MENFWEKYYKSVIKSILGLQATDVVLFSLWIRLLVCFGSLLLSDTYFFKRKTTPDITERSQVFILFIFLILWVVFVLKETIKHFFLVKKSKLKLFSSVSLLIFTFPYLRTTEKSPKKWNHAVERLTCVHLQLRMLKTQIM